MLRVDGVHKVFFRGEPNEVVALRGVSLHLMPGEFVTVIGSNGAGKSTLLKVVSGVYACDRGRLALGGENITRVPPHKRASRIARVAQNPLEGTAGELTVAENLALAARRGLRRGAAVAVNPQRLREFAEHLAPLGMGLEGRLSTPARFLSGGQRQALSIMMATIRRPYLLLLDEPTASLDPRAAGIVEEVIDRVVRLQGFSTLMVTHNLEQALRLGSRTVIMHGGQIVADLRGDHRRHLGLAELVEIFHNATGAGPTEDRMVLGGW